MLILDRPQMERFSKIDSNLKVDFIKIALDAVPLTKKLPLDLGGEISLFINDLDLYHEGVLLERS